MPSEVKLVKLWMEGDLGTAPYTGQDVIEGFDQIGGVDIVGDVYGDIVTTAGSQNSNYLIKGNLHGNLIALDGYHRDIKILSIGGTGGNLYGDIIAENGWIKLLEVDESIGSPGSPVNIWTRNTLNTLICQDLYANIDTTLYGTSAGIFTLRVESGDLSRGNFDGSIRTGYVVDDEDDGDGAFVITGDVLGEISVDRDFGEDTTIGTFSSDDPLFIGEQYEADTLTQFTDPLGLQGQMIINGHNGTYGWLGEVECFKDGNFVALAPVPYYNNETDDIGGGAVGLVPYYLHYTDCTPTATTINENATTGLDGYNPTQCIGFHIDKVLMPGELLQHVTLHHYGPIDREGAGMPVTIHRRPMSGIDCSWTDITSSFSVVMHPGDNRRDIRVRRIQDLNLNGMMQPDDIAAWVLDPQDTTLDGTTDNDDLIDVIDAVAEYGE